MESGTAPPPTDESSQHNAQMTRLVFDHLTNWITAADSEHSHDLAAHIEERTGASHRAAMSALKRLVDAGWRLSDEVARLYFVHAEPNDAMVSA